MPEHAPTKVMVIVGTRPEIIKLCRVIAEIERHFELVLVHTGQNYDYELNEIFFKDLGVRRPDHMLEAVGDTLGETIGQIIARADAVMAEENPDALLVLGDTNSCLSVIPAKRRRIPVFHMEAGNRCFDERVPEEINRRIVDHVSDINLAYTEHARRYLLSEGLPPERVMKTGSPMREVLEHYRGQIEASDVLSRLELEPRRFFVVSAHREENVDEPRSLETLLHTLNGLAERYDHPVIVSTHARTRDRMERLVDQPAAHPLVRFLKPLGFFDYVRLQQQAFCVLSDSGTITEESSMLGFPAVTIRHAHERPEGMDEGTLIMCGLGEGRVEEAVRIVTEQFADGVRMEAPADYAAGNVAAKIVRIIASYTDFVKQTVWREPPSWVMPEFTARD